MLSACAHALVWTMHNTVNGRYAQVAVDDDRNECKNEGKNEVKKKGRYKILQQVNFQKNV